MHAIEETTSRVRLNDAELEKGLREHATKPLVAIMRYPDPHATVNPTIQVILRPLGGLAGRSPKEILELVIQPVQKAFPDFQFLKRPETSRVSGLDAAHMRATYTAQNADGHAFPVTSRM